jgi:outer membrane lipoprotein-sorting protein
LGREARKRTLLCAICGLAGLLIAGCAAQQKAARQPANVPAHLQTATKQQLVTAYNQQASSIQSVNASVSMKLTAGMAYSGIIKQYHEISGFILTQKPADIRVIGQAPIVGTTIFDMASDGKTFHMYVPSKNTFVEGPADLQHESAKAIENLRPQHLVQAIFWNSIAANQPILFSAGDEAEARYYILTVLANAPDAGSASVAGQNGSPDWRIKRRIWFDRMDMNVARVQIYDASGNITSDIRYAGWHSFGNVRFSENVVITRPAEGYQLQIQVKKLTANQPIPVERFEMKQPAGTKLVRVGEEAEEPKP